MSHDTNAFPEVRVHTSVVRMHRERLPQMAENQRRLGVECSDEIKAGDYLEYQDWATVPVKVAHGAKKGQTEHVQRLIPHQYRVDSVEYCRLQAAHEFSAYQWYCMLHVTHISTIQP